MAADTPLPKAANRTSTMLAANFGQTQAQPAELSLQCVSCVLPAKKKELARALLSELSCVFPPGKASAIMGVSGSGKTTVLTLLRGLVPGSAKLTGSLMFNGRPPSLEQMRSLVFAVPQEDTFLPSITVFETLHYLARLRSTGGTPEDALRRRVESVIQLLRLETCQGTEVGDEKSGQRGISGGEKKRLSIGMALMGGIPPALLLDEPTSGLDYAAAEDTVELMSSLAARGVTVICSIHQPSYEMFSQFAHLLLMHNGAACYSGPTDKVEAYFKRHDAPTPPHTNPADHYIDCIQCGATDWISIWASNREEGLTASSTIPGQRSGQRSDPEFWHHLQVLTARTLQDNFNNKTCFRRGVMSRLPASIACGMFFLGIGGHYTQPSLFPFQGILFLCVQNQLIETFYAAATATQFTRGILRREYYDGLYTVAPFAIAYYLGQLAMQIPWAVVWATPIYFLTGMPQDIARFAVFLLTTFMIIMMSCTAGSAVGTYTRTAEGNRAVLGPMVILMVLFSGYVIPVEQISSIYMPIYYGSPIQWGMSILNFNHFQGVKFRDCPPGSKGCFHTGEEYLESSTTPLAHLLGVPGMLLICCVYVVFFALLHIRLIHRCVLDGRV